MVWTRTEETRQIGQRVRAERIQAGLSRTELGQLIGTSPDMITQYEMGYKMSDLRLSKIAKTLGRSYDYMRTGKGSPYAAEMFRPGSLEPESLTPTATALFAELEPAIRRVVREEVARALRAVRTEMLQMIATSENPRPKRRPARTSRRGGAPGDAGASRGHGSARTG